MPPRFDQKIAEGVEVTPAGWTVLPIEPDVGVQYQILRIDLSVPNARMDLDNEFAYLSDGTLIDAEVEIQDRNGEWHGLEGGSFAIRPDGDDENSFRVSRISFQLECRTLPPEIRFASVRIRAQQAFTCSRVGWHCYKMK